MFGKYIDIIHANIINITESDVEKGKELISKYTKIIATDKVLSGLYEDYNKVRSLDTDNVELFKESVSGIIYGNKVKSVDLSLLENFISDNDLDINVEISKLNTNLDKAIFEEVSAEEMINVKENIRESLMTVDTEVMLEGEGKKAYDIIFESKVNKLSNEYNVDKDVIEAILNGDKQKVKESFDKELETISESFTNAAFEETSDLDTFNLVKETVKKLNVMKENKEPNLNDFEELFILKGFSNEKSS